MSIFCYCCKSRGRVENDTKTRELVFSTWAEFEQALTGMYGQNSHITAWEWTQDCPDGAFPQGSYYLDLNLISDSPQLIDIIIDFYPQQIAHTILSYLTNDCASVVNRDRSVYIRELYFDSIGAFFFPSLRSCS
jgi:hypothetical protein